MGRAVDARACLPVMSLPVSCPGRLRALTERECHWLWHLKVTVRWQPGQSESTFPLGFYSQRLRVDVNLKLGDERDNFNQDGAHQS